jgi:hypothetical protein
MPDEKYMKQAKGQRQAVALLERRLTNLPGAYRSTVVTKYLDKVRDELDAFDVVDPTRHLGPAIRLIKAAERKVKANEGRPKTNVLAIPPLKPDQIAYLRELREASQPLKSDDPRMDEPFCTHEQCRRPPVAK